MNLRAKTVLFLATGGHIGKIPPAPGTLGSVEGLLFCFLLSKIPFPAAVGGIAGFILLAVLVSGEAEKILGREDPGCIVIDEIAGMMVTLAGIGFTPISAGIGLLCFRVFDILKPPPIRTLQDRLHGGWGIVLDDVAAGLAAHLVLRLVLRITGWI